MKSKKAKEQLIAIAILSSVFVFFIYLKTNPEINVKSNNQNEVSEIIEQKIQEVKLEIVDSETEETAIEIEETMRKAGEQAVIDAGVRGLHPELVKLQVRGGAANPSPPVGPALGAAGVNIMEFCKQFNARTQDKPGKVVPVVITVYGDKSFDFVLKTPPAAVQIMEQIKIKKGSAEPNRMKVGSITWDQIRTIAEDKLPDLNCFTVDSAMMMVAGTARSMGVNVRGKNAPKSK